MEPWMEVLFLRVLLSHRKLSNKLILDMAMPLTNNPKSMGNHKPTKLVTLKNRDSSNPWCSRIMQCQPLTPRRISSRLINQLLFRPTSQPMRLLLSQNQERPAKCQAHLSLTCPTKILIVPPTLSLCRMKVNQATRPRKPVRPPASTSLVSRSSSQL